jgi:N-hydroxyarylamine O-acetyltransferase
MNKQKYLDRINYAGSREPVLQTLTKLQKTHLLYVPFENLDIHNNVPIELNIGKIYKKVVEHRRGGFCYELNGLFYVLLCELGFDAKLISARVFKGNGRYTPEFDHLTLIVKIDDTDYLTDVGFGEFIFEPLKLELGLVQNDARGKFVIDKYRNGYFRVTKLELGKSVPAFIFKNQAREFQDYEGMNKYHQTNHDSPFMKKRLISAPTENGRITITGNILKIKENDSLTEKELANEAEFDQALVDLFKIKLRTPNPKKQPI